MRHTTRFNPTTNGALHIGHAYTALVNQHEAHASGGKFILRFDDNTRYWMHALGGRAAMAEIAKGQQEDLEWLGITADQIVYQSEQEAEVLAFLATSKWIHAVDHGVWNTDVPHIISDPPIAAFGLTSFISAERVVSDHMLGANLLIRGNELLSENGHYLYLCALFGFEPPTMWYIPRLMTADADDLGDVSKTAGNWKIKDIRERGHSPALVRQVLAESCLIDLRYGWSLDNIKPRPVLAAEIAGWLE